MFVAEVYRNTTSGKRLLQRKRKLLTRGEFGTRDEAYAFANPYFHNGYPTQIFFVGYFPEHPVDAQEDDNIILEHIKATVRDYFGDDYEGWRWEEQHAEMLAAEEAKKLRRDNLTKDNGSPF